MQESINVNVAEFLDPSTGDVDRARSYWNNRLAPSLGTEVMEVDLIREAFGEFDEVANMSDEDVQSLWDEATGAWPSDISKLNKYQRAAFHKVYTDRVVNQVVNEMEQDAFQLDAGKPFINKGEQVELAGKIDEQRKAGYKNTLNFNTES